MSLNPLKWWSWFKKGFLLKSLPVDLLDYNQGNAPLVIDEFPLGSEYLQKSVDKINAVQSLVKAARECLGYRADPLFNFDALNAAALLFHLERVLIKLREHFLNFGCYIQQFEEKEDILSKMEFLAVRTNALQCYEVLDKIISLMGPQAGFTEDQFQSRLISNPFIHLLRSLELKGDALYSAIRNVNQLSNRQEALKQIAKIEATLIQALSQQPLVSTVSFGQTLFKEMHVDIGGSPCSTIEYLRSRAGNLIDPRNAVLIEKMIAIYESLTKCYVVSRKMVVKRTLEKISEEIESLIHLLMHTADASMQTEVIQSFHEIYRCIESLHFCGNQQSRSVRQVFDKARDAKKAFRRACLGHPIGCLWLDEMAVSRSILLRPRA